MDVELIGFGRKCQLKSESFFQIVFLVFFLNIFGLRTETRETVGRDNGLKFTSR